MEDIKCSLDIYSLFKKLLITCIVLEIQDSGVSLPQKYTKSLSTETNSSFIRSSLSISLARLFPS